MSFGIRSFLFWQNSPLLTSSITTVDLARSDSSILFCAPIIVHIRTVRFRNSAYATVVDVVVVATGASTGAVYLGAGAYATDSK